MGEGQYEADVPVSARIRADIGPDGIPHMVDGRILVDKGVRSSISTIRSPDSDRPRRVQPRLGRDAPGAWSCRSRCVSGGNRITLLAQFDAPRDGGGAWGLKVSGGTVVLASAAPADPSPLVLNRFLLRMRVDPDKQRIDLEQGEFGNMRPGRRALGQPRLFRATSRGWRSALPARACRSRR